MSNLEPQDMSTNGGPYLKFTNQANPNTEYSLSVLTNPGGQVLILNPGILLSRQGQFEAPTPNLPVLSSHPHFLHARAAWHWWCEALSMLPANSHPLATFRRPAPHLRRKPSEEAWRQKGLQAPWTGNMGSQVHEHGVDPGFAKFSVNGHIVNILGFVGPAVSIVTT